MTKIYVKHVLKGLDYLHSKGIVHRDIKGANVLVDNEGVCKLADFGGAKSLLQEDSGPQFMGTINWSAPEILRGEPYTRFADIWSLGCLMIEMLTGVPPWHHEKDKLRLLNLIAKTQTPPPLPAGISEEAASFLKQCL